MSKIPPKIVFPNKPADEMILAGYGEPTTAKPYPESKEELVYDITEAEAIADLKDSNLNTIVMTTQIYTPKDQHTQDLLQYASDNNLSVFIRDLGVTTGRNVLIEKTEEGHYEYFRDEYTPLAEKYSAFAGLHFLDEPGYRDWPNYAPVQRAFRKAWPDKVFFLNLLQTYAPTWAFPNGPFKTPDAPNWLPPDPDVEKYYQSYIDIVKPDFFSYDHYPIKNAYPEVEPDYFYQLHLSYKYAAQRNIPIFAFMQVGAWGDRCRIPTEDELRYQVNCAIAYNTKHLGYYTYRGTNSYAWNHTGMIDCHANKTKQWYKIQKINKELLFQDEYFLNAGFVGYIQTGVTPSGEKPHEDERIKKFGLLKDLPDGNLFIGCFEYERDGRVYNMYYVVNNDLVNEVHGNMTFKKPITYTQIHRTNKTVIKSNEAYLSLTPGDACIIIEGLND